METLSDLGVPQESLDSMVTAGNKMDLLPLSSWPDLKRRGMVPISATQGLGLERLCAEVEWRLLRLTGRRSLRVRCRTGSGEDVWLWQNCAVTSRQPCPRDANYSLLSLVATEAEMGRFKKLFLLN